MSIYFSISSKIPANCHVRFTLFRLSKFNLKIQIYFQTIYAIESFQQLRDLTRQGDCHSLVSEIFSWHRSKFSRRIFFNEHMIGEEIKKPFVSGSIGDATWNSSFKTLSLVYRMERSGDRAVCTQINEPYPTSFRLGRSLKNLFVCTQ